MRRHLDEVSEATGVSLCVDWILHTFLFSGEGFVIIIITLRSPFLMCCTKKREKCTESDAADGDAASRLIGRAGKVGRLSGNDLAISKRPSI